MTTTLSLGAVLGKGAYGMVYQGWLRQPGQQGAAVAVKVVEDLGGSNSSDQVRHEVRMMRAASHKCNVALLAEFVYREKAWLVLELCAAGSVADLVSPRRGGRTLDERQIAAVSAGAARGLAHLHDVCSVVHRDVKAANLLLTAGGEVKLADFGISRILEGSAIQGTVIGTPMWMAPELIMGSVETAGDLWSLGITMIEMAQGEPPLAAVKPHHAQLFKIVSSDPPKLAPPSEAAELHRSLYGTEPAATVGEWSPHFVALLTRCLQKEPSERPRASEVAGEPWCADASPAALLPRLSVKEEEVKEAVLPAGEAPQDGGAGGGAGGPTPLPSLLGEDGPLPGMLRVDCVVGYDESAAAHDAAVARRFASELSTSAGQRSGGAEGRSSSTTCEFGAATQKVKRGGSPEAEAGEAAVQLDATLQLEATLQLDATLQLEATLKLDATVKIDEPAPPAKPTKGVRVMRRASTGRPAPSAAAPAGPRPSPLRISRAAEPSASSSSSSSGGGGGGGGSGRSSTRELDAEVLDAVEKAQLSARRSLSGGLPALPTPLSPTRRMCYP